MNKEKIITIKKSKLKKNEKDSFKEARDKYQNAQKGLGPGYHYEYPESLSDGKWPYPSGGS